MNKQTESENRTNALMATGLLTEFALLQSMSKSKTLTAMVATATVLIGGFALFLVKMAGG